MSKKKVDLVDDDFDIDAALKGKEFKPEHFVKIYLMGKEYEVPAGLTIMSAIEYAGYLYKRGAGCRAGFCGACGTVYRLKDDYKLQTALACQATVEDGMYLVQLPFVPGKRVNYNLDEIKLNTQTLLKNYPEVARCVACNTCTKACPQDLEVMDYIQAAKRGDVQRCSELSFDCIQCGLCAIRCPAEITHYNVAQLARRLYGKYVLKDAEQLKTRVEEVESGTYKEEFEKLLGLETNELRKLYVARKTESAEK